MRDIRVATVQFQHAPGDKTYNLSRVRHFVTEAARASAELIAFPEMCPSRPTLFLPVGSFPAPWPWDYN